MGSVSLVGWVISHESAIGRQEAMISVVSFDFQRIEISSFWSKITDRISQGESLAFICERE